MASHLVLFRFTDQGLRNIRESSERVRAAKENFAAQGVEVLAFYFLLGRYDTMFLVKGTDEAVATACLAEASKGNVRTETLRSFSEEEYGRVLAALS